MTGIVLLTESNYVVPLVTNLYSSIMEGHKSINDETTKQIDNILTNIITDQHATISFDRGYNASSYVSYIDEKDHFYVIRAKSV